MEGNTSQLKYYYSPSLLIQIMTGNSFFDEQKEQSLIKARIVEKYFWVWAKVIIPTAKKSSSEPKIAYIDLFAGAGRYKDGSKSTPVKVLETAISDPDMRNMLISIFNDVDADNVNSLQPTLRTNLSGDNAVVTKGWIVGMGFNQSWLQV